MRPMVVLLVLACTLASGVASASGVEAALVAAPPPAAALQSAQQPVDQHDGSRVGVQLVIAGIAAGLVVGAGGCAYLLRRKLGRTAYSPDQASNAHH